MSAYENLLTIGILLALGIIGYCKITNRTFIELVREIRDLFAEETEEVIN